MRKRFVLMISMMLIITGSVYINEAMIDMDTVQKSWDYVKEELNDTIIIKENMLINEEELEDTVRRLSASLNANKAYDDIYFRVDKIQLASDEQMLGEQYTTQAKEQLLATSLAFESNEEWLVEGGSTFKLGEGLDVLDGIEGEYRVDKSKKVEVPVQASIKPSNIGVFGDINIIEVMITQLNSKTGKEIESLKVPVLMGENIKLKPIYFMEAEERLYYYTDETLIEVCMSPVFDKENGRIEIIESKIDQNVIR